MSRDLDELTEALRKLIGVIYVDLKGAYGGDYYEGQYEREIVQLAKVIISLHAQGD